jgi:hypothetical protein
MSNVVKGKKNGIQFSYLQCHHLERAKSVVADEILNSEVADFLSGSNDAVFKSNPGLSQGIWIHIEISACSTGSDIARLHPSKVEDDRQNKKHIRETQFIGRRTN